MRQGPEQPSSRNGGFSRILRGLFSPTPRLKDIRDQANSQLLAAILVTMAACFAVVDLTLSLSEENYTPPWFGYVFLVSAFLVNRFLSYWVAASLTCLMFPVVLFMDILLPGHPASFQALNYFAVAVILAAILLSRAQAIIYTSGVIGFMALLPPLFPDRVPGYPVVLTPLMLNVICAVLAVILRSHLERIEKTRQAELRKSRDEYRSLVESMPDFIIRLNPEGRIVYVSPNSLPQGGDLTDLLGKTISEAGYSENTVARIDSVLESVRQDGKQRTLEYTAQGPNGPLTFSAVFRPETRSDGTLVSVLVVARDVTERKKLETRLRQSEKMQAVGQLAGGIAHDFNNQLGGIMGYADLLYAELPDGEHRSFADMIRQSAKRASGLTGQLLAFSRKGNPVAKPVDVHAIVLEVIGLLSRSLDPRIVLKPRLQAGKSVIAGDPDQIQNALLNLAINARDAIKETGEIVFETSVAELDARFCRETGIESPPGRFLVVSVSDTGQGMDQETLGHIFEPFFTTKKEGVGTGLGLSAVYGTVKNHLGAVTVYSESGHGTVFKIYLPLPQTEMPRSEERPETEDGKGRGRLLVVEDEAHLRGLLKTVLTRSGYEVTCCADGVEALEHYARRWKETDLVILDMVMPRMNGRETFQKMKEINPSVRAILSSGFSLDGEAAEMRKAGILDFVQKPYLINEILKSVRNGLKG